MKIKNLLSLAFALILAVSCLSITAFADTTSYDDDITISVTPEIGDTPATLISKAVLSDSTNLEITEARIFDTDYNSLESIATSGTYNIAMTVKLKNYTAFAKSGNKYAGEFTLKGLSCNMFDVCYGWDIDEEEPKTAPYENHTTISYLVFDAEITLYDATLDLEDDDTYPDTKTVDQLYDATVTTNKTDKTKVQVSWKLEDIAVTVTNNKIWNTETLTWDPDTSKTNGAAASDPTAEFNFVNLSSKDVYAKVTFAKASGIANEPTKAFTDNEETAGAGDGIIKLGNKATDSTTDNTGKIKLALTVTDSDFDSVSAGTGTYGKYTVTISDKDPGVVYYTLTGETANSRELNSIDLLASDTITYNTNLVAYNGYIDETSGANFADAQAFVAALNAKKITPSGATGGTWRLLNSSDDISAWHTASSTNSFGNVEHIWANVANGSGYGDLYKCSDKQMAYYKSGNVTIMGFVVIWEPTAQQ